MLTGDGDLVCDISAKENGHQKLTIVAGGGLEFDVAVSPIVDGTVTTEGPDKGRLVPVHVAPRQAGQGQAAGRR